MTATGNHQFVSGLYGVTPDWDDTERLEAAIRAAARGGMSAVQLRHKTASAKQRLNIASHCLRVCADLGLPLILNDDWRLAKAIGADGVHLGRDDDDPGMVREALGDKAIIGVSCYGDNERACAMIQHNVDYVAFGAMFASGTKPQAPLAKLAVLTQARADLLALDPRPAVVAIGGITPDNAASVLAAGADSLAVVGGLFLADNIEQTARDFTTQMTAKPANTEL